MAKNKKSQKKALFLLCLPLLLFALSLISALIISKVPSYKINCKDMANFISCHCVHTEPLVNQNRTSALDQKCDIPYNAKGEHLYAQLVNDPALAGLILLIFGTPIWGMLIISNYRYNKKYSN